MYKALLLIALFASAFMLAPASAAVEGTVRVSVDANGTQLAAPSGAIGTTPSLSSTGSSLVFESLGPASRDDDNGASDIFYRDIDDGATSVVSVTADGTPGNNRSYAPSLSEDGRMVAFESMASDLVEDDENRYPDVFVRDREDETTERVSISTEEEEGNGPSGRPAISADGNIVAFCSGASNLAPDDGNGVSDVFVRDRGAGATQRIVPPGATGAPAEGCERVALTADGALLTFSYRVANGVGGAVSQVYLQDRRTGDTRLLSAALAIPGNGASGVNGLAVSHDGGVVFFDSLASDLVADDNNSRTDVFAWENDTVTRISVSVDGAEANGDSGQLGLSTSANGQYVVFASNASNIVPGDGNLAADIFRLNRRANEVTIASVDAGEHAGNGPSYSPDVSDDGGTVSFVSLATSLIYGDRNRHPDVFLRGGVFPATGGLEGEPIATPPPDDTVALPEVNLDEDEGVSALVLAGGIAGAIVLVLVVGSLLLGRAPKA